MATVMDKFNNKWLQIKSIIGQALLPVISDFVDYLEGLSDDQITAWLDKAMVWVQDFGKALANLAKIVNVVSSLYGPTIEEQNQKAWDDLATNSGKWKKNLKEGADISKAHDRETRVTRGKEIFDKHNPSEDYFGQNMIKSVGGYLRTGAQAIAGPRIRNRDEQNDFVMQAGTVTPFSSQDTIIGSKGPIVDLSGLESKMDILINITREGKVIKLNDRDVTRELDRSADRPKSLRRGY